MTDFSDEKREEHSSTILFSPFLHAENKLSDETLSSKRNDDDSVSEEEGTVCVG